MSKTSRHEKFDSWSETILAQPKMKKKLNEPGIMKATTIARKMVVDRKPADLKILMSSLSVDTHTFNTAWREFGPTLEDVIMLSSLSLFGEAQVAILTEGETRKASMP